MTNDEARMTNGGLDFSSLGIPLSLVIRHLSLFPPEKARLRPALTGRSVLTTRADKVKDILDRVRGVAIKPDEIFLSGNRVERHPAPNRAATCAVAGNLIRGRAGTTGMH